MTDAREAFVAALADPWPLVGRGETAAALVEVLDAPHAAVFLVGEAGCGKSRLAHEILDLAASRGRSTARAIATESSRHAPLGALAHLVPGAAADSSVPLLQAVHEARAARAADDALVLHLDDAQHLDTSSATLLLSLAAAGWLRLLVTVRSGTILPEGLAALRTAPGSHSVEVGPLARAEVATLLARVLRAPVDGAAEDALWEMSRGNPLYLRELVLGGVGDGSLTQVGGVWQLAGDLPATEPLVDRVLGRLSALGDGARRALELVCVGAPIGLDPLEEMAGADALEELEQRGLIRVDQDRRRMTVSLSHPIYGEVLRSSMGRVRTRAHAAALAASLEAQGLRRSTDRGRLVRLQLDAGAAPDPLAVLDSARVARHHNDWLTAAKLARVAYEGGLDDAAYLLAESHYALGEFDEADMVAEPALAEPGRLTDQALTGLHRTRAGVWFFGSTDPEEAQRQVREASDRITDPDLRDMLRYAQAAMCMWSGRVREARALAEPLLDAADPKVRVQAAIAVETVNATAGPAVATIEMADEWYARHAALPDLNGTNSPAFHLLVKTEALVNAGWFDQADALAEMGYQLSVSSRNRIAQMWFARERGRVAAWRGRASAARGWFLETVALCRGTAWLRPMALGLSDLAMAEADLGNGEAARAAIAERDGLGVPVVELFASEAVRATAATLAVEGDLVEARRLLVDGALAAETEGIVLLGAFARLDAVRLGATDQADALDAAAEWAASDIVTVAARWARALDDATGLEEVAADLDRLGSLRLASEAMRMAAARWQDDGEPRRASAARREADVLARRADGTRATPRVEGTGPEGPEAPPLLTPREHEIAQLAADGLPSKAIASQLYLSPRTVSNHLQNVYAKLGVSKRTELGDVLARLDAELAV